MNKMNDKKKSLNCHGDETVPPFFTYLPLAKRDLGLLKDNGDLSIVHTINSDILPSSTY